MEMMCTRVFSCVCSCISEFTCHLISIVSLVVAIPVGQCSVSPKNGSRLLLGHGLSEVVDLSKNGLVLSICIAVHMVGSYDWYMLLIFESSPKRVLNMKLDVHH